MTRLTSIVLAALCVGFVSLDTARAGDLVPPHIAAQMGMTEAWKRNVQLPAGAQSIVSQQLFVHQQKPREYIEITVPVPDSGAASTPDAEPETRVLLRIPTDRMGVDGEEIGKKEAERLANNELRRLKRRGYDATISSQKVPRIHLYTLADDGTVECRDAETGDPVWLVRVGDHQLKYGELGVSEDHISVINGANLIQLDVSNGEVIETVATMGTPLHGAVHAGRFAMVPTIRSGVEGYPMYDPTLDPFMEVVAGIALNLPTKAPDLDTTRVAWGTAKGFVYVMELSGEPSVLFRLDTDGIVSGRIASAPGNRFFFGSEAGVVYCIRATRTGRVLWNQPFGEPFYNGPMVVGDKLLIRSTYGTLYGLRTEDGSMAWNAPTPSIDEILVAIGDHVYVRTLSGTLAVLDLNTGDRIRTFREVQPGRLLKNTVTDRLYLVNSAGAVQCLRPENAVMPTLRDAPDIEPVEETQPAAPAAAAGASPFDPNATADPFGAGAADPFGGNADDPFGGGDAMDDPFGGGDAADDPFGADPFGGN